MTVSFPERPVPAGTANRDGQARIFKQGQVFAAKRHKIHKVLMFPLLRPLRFFVADSLALGFHR
jgi:hypothetical protein